MEKIHHSKIVAFLQEEKIKKLLSNFVIGVHNELMFRRISKINLLSHFENKFKLLENSKKDEDVFLKLLDSFIKSQKNFPETKDLEIVEIKKIKKIQIKEHSAFNYLENFQIFLNEFTKKKSKKKE